jgi:hypothetical protein
MDKIFKGSKITFEHIQIKSLRKARRLAKALNVIEIECGIQSVEFVLMNSFICCDIDEDKLIRTPMEKVLKDLIKSYRNE